MMEVDVPHANPSVLGQAATDTAVLIGRDPPPTDEAVAETPGYPVVKRATVTCTTEMKTPQWEVTML
jgi:hypothetical protein